MKKVNSKSYWKNFTQKEKLLFKIKSYLFNLNIKKNKIKENNSLNRSLLKTVLFESIPIALLVFILIVFEKNISSNIFPILNDSYDIDSTDFINILIALISISGIFLALFYSNIASVYSTKYYNAPREISQLFENEFVTSHYIKDIISYNIFIIFLIIFNLLGFTTGYIILFLTFILTIYIIIAFSKIGNRVLEFSDFNALTKDIYKKIKRNIKNSTVNGIFWNDRNFQFSYKKHSQSNLSLLYNIYELSIKDNNNQSILLFILNNLNLIDFYLSNKHKIPYNSFWFEKKHEYNSFFNSSSIEKNFMLNTGFSGNPKITEKKYWFENYVFDLNVKLLDKLLDEKEYLYIHNFLTEFENKISSLISQLDINYFYIKLDEIFYLISNKINYSENDEKILSIVEKLCQIYITSTIKIINVNNENIINNYENLSVNILNNEFNIKSILNNGNLFTNKEYFFDLVYKIENEIKIEKTRITPNWFINQFIINEFNSYIIDCNEISNFKLSEIFIINSLIHLKKENNKLADIFYTRAFEYHHKLINLNNILNQIYNENSNFYIEKDIQWESNFKNHIELNQNYISNLITDFSKHLIYNSNYLKNDKESPDTFGFTYFHLLDMMYRDIFELNISAFENNLKLLYDFSIASENKILKNTVNKNNKLFLLTKKAEIWIDFYNILGFAFIIGEIFEEEKIKNIVKDFYSNLSSTQNDFNFFLERQLISISNGIYYNNFHSITSKWIDILIRKIEDERLLNWEQKRHSSSKRLITNNKFLAKFFFSNELHIAFGRNKLFKLAIEIFLNPYLPDDKKLNSYII